MELKFIWIKELKDICSFVNLLIFSFSPFFLFLIKKSVNLRLNCLFCVNFFFNFESFDNKQKFLQITFIQSSYWADPEWEVGDLDDANARRAYEALLRVSLLQPSSQKYEKFAEGVKRRAFVDYNYTFFEGEEVNFFIGAFFDGVYLLGMALNETLHENGHEGLRDGLAITKRMWNRNFRGKNYE